MNNIGNALVLAGGGAKGAYEIGVWKALKELKIKINAVFGNSVGAINGALIAQGDFQLAVNLWRNLGINHIINLPDDIVPKTNTQLAIFAIKVYDVFLRQYKDKDKDLFKKVVKSFRKFETGVGKG